MIRRLKRAAKRNAARPYRWRWLNGARPTFENVLKACYGKADVRAWEEFTPLTTQFHAKLHDDTLVHSIARRHYATWPVAL